MVTHIMDNTDNVIMKKTVLLPWVVCVASSLFFFYEFIQGNMFASIADNIMVDFHIQAGKMTYLSSVYYLSNVIFLFVAGVLLDKFSTKKTMLVAMALCVLSTFVLAYADSFYLALACRFVAGIGSAFCFLAPIRIASRWFPPKRMALVTGVIVTIAMSGGMLAQYPLTKLVLQVGWRDALLRVGWLGVLMLALMALWIRDKPGHEALVPHEPMQLKSLAKRVYLNAQTIRAALYTSLMNMSVAVFGAMMGSLYVMERLGVGKAEASMVNGMLFFGAIIGGPVIGWCSDRMTLRILPMRCSAVLALGTMLLILYAPLSLNAMAVLFFLLGFFTAAQVISYALVAESSPPVMTAMAVSMVSILTQGGYIVYQNIFSFLLSSHAALQGKVGASGYALADYQAAAVILPLGLCLALGLMVKLHETHCRPIQG